MRPWWVLVAVVAVALGVVVSTTIIDRSATPVIAVTPDSTPTPTRSARAPGFPGPDTTGVPEGTGLRRYDGPCTIETPATAIVDSEVQCDRLIIHGAGVTIARSRLNIVDVDFAGASVTIEDSEIRGGSRGAAVGFGSLTLRRVEVTGGDTSVLCGSDCLIEDSWLHDQVPPEGDEHLNGYLSNGGTQVVVRHNTIECTPADNDLGGGCSGDAQIYGDFDTLSDYTFEDNLFKATPGGFCTSFGYDPPKKFGDRPREITVTNNTYERGPAGTCGTYGPATSYRPGQGNRWKNNTWVGGESLDHP